MRFALRIHVPTLAMLVSLAAFTWPNPAYALLTDPFTAPHDLVLMDCAKAGGVFREEDDGGYGCTKHNCDGKGNGTDGDNAHNCTVACDEGGTCRGQTPDILPTKKVTILMLLQDGSNVNHSY